MTNAKLNPSEVRAEPAASKRHRLIQLGWIQTQFALADAVHSCYEAGPFGYGLHRELVALGVRNVVVQPVCLDERHTGVNHDPSDARELALRPWPPCACPRPSRSKNAAKAGNANNCAAKSSAWPPKAGDSS